MCEKCTIKADVKLGPAAVCSAADNVNNSNTNTLININNCQGWITCCVQQFNINILATCWNI